MLNNLLIKMRNKYFWVSMVSLFVMLLEQLGIDLPIDINEIATTILSILVLMGILNDNGVDKNNNGIADFLEGGENNE